MEQVVARVAHYHEVAGSTPAPATKLGMVQIPNEGVDYILAAGEQPPADLLDRCKGNTVLAFTGGQFSMMDWVEAMMHRAGPCHVDMCSWTASRAAALRIGQWLKTGKAETLRLIIDDSLASRQPRAHETLEEEVGRENIVEMSVHAKWARVTGREAKLSALMSGNLTSTPACEFYLVSDGEDMYDALGSLSRSVWSCDLDAGRVWGQVRSKSVAGSTMKTVFEIPTRR